MPEYRAYLIGPDGHFFTAKELVHESEAAALEAAKQLVDGHAIELWQGNRKIATFDAKPE